DRELVALEDAAGEHPAALAPAGDALHHDVALAGVGAGDEQRGARLRVDEARGRERDLLPDARRQVRVEREHELLDLPALRVARRATREAAGVRHVRAARARLA